MTGRETSAVPQLLGAAVGVVVGAALLFALLGTLRSDDTGTPEVTDAPSEDVVADGDEDGSSAPADDTGDAADDDAGVGSPAPDAEDGGDDAGDATAGETDEADGTEDPADEPSEEPTEPAATVDPASVSIQVLDGVLDDDEAAATAVADELRAAGYDVVVVNPSRKEYTETSVFWTPGHEDAGRQVAADLGATRFEETPSDVELSDSVAVHVVVGSDRT